MSVRASRWPLRRWKFAVILSALSIFLVGLFMFAPVTFIQKEYQQSKISHIAGPYTVVRWGHSRFSETWFEDGPGYGGSVYRGRCFIDYIDDGHVVRLYGWKLSVRTYFTLRPHRVTRVQISIE